MDMDKGIYADYRARTTLDAMSDQQLWEYRSRNQGAGRSMGAIGTARGNVVAVNRVLRAKGLLVDAKAQQAKRDTTGFVAAAVAPLKATAMDHAEQESRDYVASVVARFVGKDLNVVAPRPDNKMSRTQYRQAQSRRGMITSILKTEYKSLSGAYTPNAPEMLVRDEAKEARYIKDDRDAAGVSFDAYVMKLEGKVGQGVTAASVDGRLWTGSVLTVQKGDVTERWHTQQIINRSVLGTLFNQWPTRLMK